MYEEEEEDDGQVQVIDEEGEGEDEKRGEDGEKEEEFTHPQHNVFLEQELFFALSCTLGFEGQSHLPPLRDTFFLPPLCLLFFDSSSSFSSSCRCSSSPSFSSSCFCSPSSSSVTLLSSSSSLGQEL